jgi:hypothetical protein
MKETLALVAMAILIVVLFPEFRGIAMLPCYAVREAFRTVRRGSLSFWLATVGGALGLFLVAYASIFVLLSLR